MYGRELARLLFDKTAVAKMRWTCPLGWSSELTQESATLVDMSPYRRNCRLTEVFEEEGFKELLASTGRSPVLCLAGKPFPHSEFGL